MKICKLHQYPGRKHLEGTTKTNVRIPAGTRLVICQSKSGDGYELHAVAENSKSESPRAEPARK